jgi:hypothetical protein
MFQHIAQIDVIFTLILLVSSLLTQENKKMKSNDDIAAVNQQRFALLQRSSGT